MLAAFACASSWSCLECVWNGLARQQRLSWEWSCLNRNLYRFFLRRRGVLFAVGCVALHLLYYLYSGLSYLYVWTENQLRKRATIRPIAALKSAARSILSVKS